MRFHLAARRRHLLAAAATVMTVSGPLAAQGRPAPRTEAGRLEGRVRLDGILDDAAWRAAEPISGLTMVEPHQGEPGSARTTVRFLAGPNALFIGIECEDDPGAIVAYAKERDADLAGDDHIRVLLDTHLSQRSGYVFAVNPNGARYDALITDNGAAENPAWDAVWDAVAARTPQGWSVEIRLPVQSLSYRDGLREWGVNVERRIQRKLETDRWASPDLSTKFTQPARAGRLTALPAFVYGVGLVVRPAVVGGMRQETASVPRDGVLQPTVDVTQRVGAAALASVTLNTDFAETEVDTRRTNLTRFSLLFPEKRTFFLEGSDIFDFGMGLGERNPDLVPFFSRRIGLIQGQSVPLDFGGKFSGRSGGTNFGLMGVRTGEVPGLAPAASMGALRLRENVLRESSVGLIATAGDPEGRPGAWTAGGDLTFNTSSLGGNQNLRLGAWGLATHRDELTGDRTAWGLAFEFPNDTWELAANFKHIGEGFDPSLGFVPRRGVNIGLAGGSYRLRGALPGVRYAVFELHGQLVTDPGGRRESYSVFSAPVHLLFESGDGIEFNVAPQGERLDEGFPLSANVTIPAGDYQWVLYRVEGVLAAKRPVSGHASLTWGRFYTGSLRQWEGVLVMAPSPVISMQVSGQRNDARLAEGRVVQDLVGAKLQVNFTADLTLNSFLQYDNQSHQLGSSSRVRFRFHEFGELFLIHNYNLVDATAGWQYQSSQLLLKVQYALRL